jgi:hypothetical protein
MFRKLFLMALLVLVLAPTVRAGPYWYPPPAPYRPYAGLYYTPLYRPYYGPYYYAPYYRPYIVPVYPPPAYVPVPYPVYLPNVTQPGGPAAPPLPTDPGVAR